MHRWQALMYFLYSCQTFWSYITLHLNWTPSLEVDWGKREYQHQSILITNTEHTWLLLNTFSCKDERHSCTFYILFGPYTHKLQYKKVWQLVSYQVKRLLLLRGECIKFEYFNHISNWWAERVHTHIIQSLLRGVLVRFHQLFFVFRSARALGTAHITLFCAGGQLANFVSKNVTTIERWMSKDPHFSRWWVARYLVGGIKRAYLHV
jgi:hypothetical protein